MDSVGFDSTRWDHWLLVVCFVAIATYGIWVTWQWRRAARQAEEKARTKAKLARRLAIEIRSDQARSPKSYSAVSDTRVVEASGRFRAPL